MIYIGNYHNCRGPQTVSISGDKGLMVHYCGEGCSKLAPKKAFWQVWHDNVGIIDDSINNHYYMEHYYDDVLSKLDPMEIYQKYNGRVLLCYEANNTFCHRYLVAAWLELFLNIKVPEVMCDAYGKHIIIPYNDTLKKQFEEIINQKYEMNGYKSLRAAYLANQNNTLSELMKTASEEEANQLYLKINKNNSLIEQIEKMNQEEHRSYKFKWHK